MVGRFEARLRLRPRYGDQALIVRRRSTLVLLDASSSYLQFLVPSCTFLVPKLYLGMRVVPAVTLPA